MKVLFCPTHYVLDDGERGSELSWAYQIVDCIAGQNPESVVVTGFNNTNGKKKYKIIELQPEKNNIDLGVLNALKFNLLYSSFARRTLKAENFDILHHVLPFSIDNTFNLSFIFPPAKNVMKIIGPIQSPLPFYKDNMQDYNSKKSSKLIDTNRLLQVISKPVLRYLSLLTLKNADKIVVINKRTRDILIDRKIDKKKIVIIPPGVDTKVYTSIKKNYKENSKIEILSVGALIERKGFDSVIKGIAEVIKHNKNITLRILGNGPQKKNLEMLVKKLELEKFVIFEGHVHHREMASYYKRADIFVSMSRAEGFATVCLEAMAAGLPIISTRVGGFSDAVKDGTNGYLVEIDDYKMLSQKLGGLISDKDKIIQMGDLSRQISVETYDWKRSIIPRYNAVYKNL